MATNNIFEYTDNGLKVFKPGEGEKHLVYVRPGDQIKLEFTDNLQFRLVDGDVLAILPNGAQLIFLSLGTLSMTPEADLVPKLVDFNNTEINILDVAEITELIDQDKPINQKFLDFQPASEEAAEVQEHLSRQEERLENTLETISEYVAELSNNAIAGPQASTDAEGDQSSGTQTTVEFVQETVEKVITATEETSIPEPVNPNQQSQVAVPQPDNNPSTSTSPPAVSTTFAIEDITVLSAPGGFVQGSTTSYQGGSSREDNAPTNSITARLEREQISTASNDDTEVFADNSYLVSTSAQTMSQVISISPNTPDNFFTQSMSFSGLPAGVRVYSLLDTNPQDITASTNPLNISGGSSFVLNEGVHYSAGETITFLIYYPVDTAAFTLTADAVAAFDTESGATTPSVTEFQASTTYAFSVADLSTVDQNSSDLFLADRPAGNIITTGAGDDTIHGGLGDDDISSGVGDDIINPGEGNDIIDGGEGIDSISYTDQPNNNFITVNMSDGNVAGSVLINDADNNLVETDIIYGIENISGTLSDDTIEGNSLDNTFDGNSGDDYISGGFGDDTLDGGVGTDTLSYTYNTDSNAEGYTINLTEGTSSLSGGGDSDSISNFEIVTGSSLDDHITGDENTNTLDGADGNDSISGGSDGSDVLSGGENDSFEITIDSESSTTSITAGDTVDYSERTSELTTTLNQESNSVNVSSGTHSGFENLRGTAFDDTIEVTSNETIDNVFYATAGADVLDAGGNNDVNIDVQDNLITITGGDTYDMSNLDTDISNLDSVEVDLLEDHQAILNIDGVQVTQTITGFEHVIGSGADDTITGTGGSNYLAGGGGDDTIFGAGGQDFIDGGEGTDIVDFSQQVSAGITINYDIANERFEAAENTAGPGGSSSPTLLINIESIYGTAQADFFTGSIGSNLFQGQAGNDTIQATQGGDTYFGGEGEDLIDYSVEQGSTEADVDRFISNRLAQLATAVSVEDGIDSTFGNDTSLNIENLLIESLTYSSSVDLTGLRIDMADTTTSTEGSSFNAVYATNTIDDSGSIIQSDTLYDIEHVQGTSGNDYLAGNTQQNSLSGGLGNDFIAGRAGDDTLEGNEGNDILSGGLGNDIIDGGDGDDWVSYQFSSGDITVDLSDTSEQDTTSEGNDTITNIENIISGSGNDTITGNTSSNHLMGGEGDDTLGGGGGTDTLDGGLGDDTASFDHAAYAAGITLSLENTGTTTAQYTSSGSQVDVALSNIEHITGSDGNDNISGNDLDNIIIGGSGNDTIEGGSSGTDSLVGGAGDDNIIYTERNGTLDGGDGTDTLDLSSSVSNFAINLNVLTDENQASTGLPSTISNFENVETGAGNQTVTASTTTTNEISLGGGNDTINGGTQGDTYSGGDGTDVISYDGNTNSITADFSTDNEISISGQVAANIDEFEKLIGSESADTITLGANAAELVEIDGNNGDDTIFIDGDSYSTAFTIDGGDGDDTLSLDNSSSDSINIEFDSLSIVTDQANNTSTSFTNIETIVGGAGADTLTALNSVTVQGETTTNSNAVSIVFTDIETLDSTNDTSGSTFQDIVSSGFSTILAGSGSDEFIITNASDGNNENIIFNADEGIDVLNMAQDGDVLTSNSTILNGTLTVNGDTYELSGFETIMGGSGNDTWDLSGFPNAQDALRIDGGEGDDNLTGGDRSDTLFGNSGNDELIGGDGGDNTLIGGAGNDNYEINGDETISFSDRENHAIEIDYSAGQILVDVDNNGNFADAVDEFETIDVDAADSLAIIGGNGDDTLSITFGDTDGLSSFDGSSHTDVLNGGDTVEISGDVNGDLTLDNNNMPTLSNIEHLDFSGINAQADDLTFSVQTLYEWAGSASNAIDDGGQAHQGNEIQLTFSAADIADWGNIQFMLDGDSGSTTAQNTGFTTNPLDVEDDGSGTNTATVNQDLQAGNQYHITFNDAANNGDNLHLVINVVA